ncbi:MAG: hypothetical protein IIX11_01300, partial [Selenomonadales bacterium]|nr:hypothetical protein [Selenomonadales bacterium]
VLTLIEKAQENIDQQKAEEMQKKMLKAEFTLEDYLEQMDQIKESLLSNVRHKRFSCVFLFCIISFL